MDTKHTLYTIVWIIGFLFLYHVMQMRGGIAGVKSGLGIG